MVKKAIILTTVFAYAVPALAAATPAIVSGPVVSGTTSHSAVLDMKKKSVEAGIMDAKAKRYKKKRKSHAAST
jgi:hypothetical protein